MLFGSNKNSSLSKIAFKVNLFIHKGDEPPLYTKLIKWALSSGRFIVVVVELIVIGAFVYRYKLDADLLNLEERIQEQIPYIKSLTEDDLLIRKVQFQLSSVKTVRAQSPRYSEILSKIATLTPKTIRLTNMSFGQGAIEESGKLKVSINGQTPSNLEVSAFIQALKNDNEFSEVTLANISFEDQTTFTIIANLNQEGAPVTENTKESDEVTEGEQ